MSTAEEGHNSGVKADELKEFARRMMKLEDDKAEALEPFTEDIKELRAEVKASGYDPKHLASVMKVLRMEEDERTVLGLYFGAFNVFD